MGGGGGRDKTLLVGFASVAEGGAGAESGLIGRIVGGSCSQ